MSSIQNSEADEKKNKLIRHIKGVILKTVILYIILTFITGVALSSLILKAQNMDSMTMTESSKDVTFKLGSYEKMYDKDGNEYILANFNCDDGSIQCNIPIKYESKVEKGIGYEGKVTIQSLSNVIFESNNSYKYISDIDFMFSKYITDDTVSQEEIKESLGSLSDVVLESNADREFTKADEVRVRYLLDVREAVSSSLSSIISTITYIVLIYVVVRILMGGVIEVSITKQKL